MPDPEKKGDSQALSPRQRIALDELAGKSFAAQSYDQTIWKIRSGFLTLTFAAWGALLTLAGDQAEMLQSVAVPMCCVTVGLALAGAFTDLCYLRRKYRCIEMINACLESLFQNIDKLDSLPTSDWTRWLRFSGDDARVKPRKVPGFKLSLLELVAVYFVPVTAILAGVMVYTN